MQEQEERRLLAQRHQQRIISELGKQKVQEEGAQPVPTKRERIEEELEQGQSSQQKPIQSPTREEEEDVPLQEPNPQVTKEDTREAKEQGNVNSPVSDEEVVEMEHVQEQNDRTQVEEYVGVQEE